jgi:hypothetical protein
MLDMLSSRRTNFDRLQHGIGLPTRDILSSQDDCEKIRTLLAVTQKSSRDQSLTYGGLLKLGAGRPDDVYGADFNWLWRSQIENYESHAGVWLKWLWRTAQVFLEFRREQGSRWESGFALYDRLRWGSQVEREAIRTSLLHVEFENLTAVFKSLVQPS